MVPAAVALALVATCPVWLPLLPAGGFWLARGLALAGSLGALMAMGRREDSAGKPALVLASPAVTLPLLALVFYSLIPALYVEWISGGPLAVPVGANPEDLHDPGDRFALYAPASTAESWVLAFAGIGLLLALFLDRLIPLRRDQAAPSPTVAMGLTLICGAGAAFHLGKWLIPSTASPWAISLLDVLPPLLMFGVALLAQHPSRRGMWTGIGLAAGMALLYPYHIKLFVLLFVTLLLMSILRSRGWMRLAIIGALLISPVLGAKIVTLARGVTTGLPTKIVLRQAESVFCLGFVLRDAEAVSDEWRAGPFYFAAGLVPRALWPEKPTLSHGGAFRKFCGVDSPSHSSSVTLLGEPALRGGPWGMEAAGLVLAGFSALVIAAWKRGGRVTVALALGLTPWLVDFDQHFAMYVANAAKAFLAILPVALLLGYLGRRKAAGSHPLS